MKAKMIIAVFLCLLLCGCGSPGEPEATADTTAWLNMNMDYPLADALEDGQGQKVKVVLLLGQSNATGCSLTSYLQQGLSQEEYAAAEQGYSSVRINFCLDDHKYTSYGAFVPVDLNCGAGQGYFGPEVGMAQVLAEAYPDETVFLLKYSMSGYSLHHHWLCAGARGSIYEACMQFVRTYMEYLGRKNYDARVIVHDKSSLAPEGKSIAFSLGDENGFHWLDGYNDITADELLCGFNAETKTAAAEDLIRDLLSDGEKVPCETIFSMAASRGISQRTVNQAKKNIPEIVTTKPSKKWFWQIPK